MSLTELLAACKKLSIRLWVEGSELRLSAPKGALTAELKAELKARKQELLEVLSQAARSVPPGGGQTENAGPRRLSDRSRLPLSFSQRRLWFLQQLDPSLTAYNIPMSWTLVGSLDEAALERAIATVVGRHEALRTVFPKQDGRPSTALLAEDAIRLERLEDLPQDEARREAEVRSRLEALAHEPFDLAEGPLLRPVLAQLAPRRHVLFCLVHHIVFDGASIDLFYRELQEAYAAACEGRSPNLAELALQYGDFAAWQNAWMQGPELNRLLEHWRASLAGEIPVLDLPLDRPRPAVQTHVGAKASVPLDERVVQGLEAFAKNEDATLFMALLAAYEALLMRIGAQRDVTVASPIAGRNVEGVEHLLGFFVNTLVLRADVRDLGATVSYRQLLGRVKENALAAYDHQEMPFERLVDELAPERTLSTTPLFQTMFLIEEAYGRADDQTQPAEAGLVFEPYALSTQVARTDLMVYAYHAQTWELWAEYNTDLFDARTVERLLSMLARLAGAVLEAPDAPLDDVELLGSQEREQLLVGWNRRGEAFPEVAIHHRFEEQVDRTPEATALVFPSVDAPEDDERLSFAELDARANRLAHHLSARGVTPGSLVGMCLERSSDMLVAQLAIQKAGAAYVPLDPSYPAERLVYMAEDAHLAHVVTHGTLDELFLDLESLAVVHLERESEAIAAASPARTGIAVDCRERMYVIYTSGSTGKPKGVELEHRSVSNFLSSMEREPGCKPGETFLALTTPSFDISVLELFLPLMCGATVAIAPREATADGTQLRSLIEGLQPDILQATPASWRLLLVAGWQGAPETLRGFSGGEALAPELADELVPRLKELWNLYGPTEATIWSTAKRVTAERPITIGKPIANTRVYVLDAARRPVPIGVTGELWIAGDGLARGYLERPELNAERFVADPFAPEGSGERMYVTGDLARWRVLPDGPDGRSEGELECLGRIDHQVKLRGFRIELGEIESVLADVDGVHECVAIVREDTPGDQRLVAYYTQTGAASGAAPDAAPGAAPGSSTGVEHETLRAAARAVLPAYMVPSSFQLLEALPLTPNGKVDRNALHALQAVTPGADIEYVPPRDPTEETIASVWSEVLGLEQVTTNTNFFDLGGHSLLLAEVHAKLQDRLPELSIIELFQYPTIRSLAEYVNRPAATEGAGRGRSLHQGRQALMQRRRIRR